MVKYAKHAKDIPNEPHWVIMRPRTIHIPGDERSKTCPGHGYPAHTEHYFEYVAYDDEEEWLKAIEKIELRHSIMSEETIAFKSSGKARVNKSINVEVNNI